MSLTDKVSPGKSGKLVFSSPIMMLIGFYSFCGFILGQRAGNTRYVIPPDLSDGLQVESVESLGIPLGSMEGLQGQISRGELGYFRALAIVKDGYLIYEGYLHGADREDRYTIYSVSKPFTSALVGMAIDKGFIKGIQQSVLSYFPEYTPLIKDEKKKDITIKHLLTLSSGFDWDESTYSYEDDRNIHVQMEHTADWIKFILQRPLRDNPGEQWVYNTGNVQLLSAILKKTTGLFAHQFAEKYLFRPLQIEDYYWNTDPMGYTCAGGSDGGLRLKTRDLVKLGALYIQNGLWKNRRILSLRWIRQSTKKQVSINNDRGYGFLWHVSRKQQREREFDMVYHSGSGGHILVIVPDMQLAVAVNSVSGNVLPLLDAIINVFMV